MAEIIDGKAIAMARREIAAKRAAEFAARYGRPPGLAVVLVGDDPASAVYVKNKKRACADAGIASLEILLDASTTQEELVSHIERLNEEDGVDGILVQLPLPAHLDSRDVLLAIDPAKDVDGFHPYNLGGLLAGEPSIVPCTPAGIMRLLEEYGVSPSGKDAVVLGRSTIVGKPMALLLMMGNATVTICHSKTRDLPAKAASADILVAAVGRPEFVRGSWIKPGAVVIDVGINRTPDGLKGDVHFQEALERASLITPVPGGVGPMTVAMLLENTVEAAYRRIGRSPGL
ncbi:MAG TPA: bifunctional methylenetetrahydrofolate dehydrogenase/methenyltetrahydrofolate cyclohydrolase FolD [Deltaproteobacteria bacterium]|nr:bifunctional methylenetetrahydrofolate dehydrogenase/methenyltetrahydrofolate cyclohydrolase FolD [Deltaproteobacteria bacterium]